MIRTKSPTNKPTEEKDKPKYKSYWSVDGQIFFNEGKAWGVDWDKDTGIIRNVCFGDEEEVLQQIKEKKNARR